MYTSTHMNIYAQTFSCDHSTLAINNLLVPSAPALVSEITNYRLCIKTGISSFTQGATSYRVFLALSIAPELPNVANANSNESGPTRTLIEFYDVIHSTTWPLRCYRPTRIRTFATLWNVRLSRVKNCWICRWKIFCSKSSDVCVVKVGQVLGTTLNIINSFDNDLCARRNCFSLLLNSISNYNMYKCINFFTDKMKVSNFDVLVQLFFFAHDLSSDSMSSGIFVMEYAGRWSSW